MDKQSVAGPGREPDPRQQGAELAGEFSRSLCCMKKPARTWRGIRRRNWRTGTVTSSGESQSPLWVGIGWEGTGTFWLMDMLFTSMVCGLQGCAFVKTLGTVPMRSAHFLAQTLKNKRRTCCHWFSHLHQLCRLLNSPPSHGQVSAHPRTCPRSQGRKSL